MKNIILISGFGGSGKSTCADLLYNSLENVAVLSADHVFRIKPFEMNTEQGRALIGRCKLKNSLSVLKNYLNEDFENIVIDGLVWSQPELDEVEKLCSQYTCICYLFWLHTSKETRINRALHRNRDNADTEEFLEVVESYIVDPRPFKSNFCSIIEVNTDEKSSLEVSEYILTYIHH